MAVVLQLVLRQAFCALCGEMFFVCRKCEHGQRYCGEVCSGKVRQRKRREYKRDYQATMKGRLNHAKRQQEYLLRKARARASKKVTDHTLVERFFSGKLAREQIERVPSMYRCWFCGRPGVVIRSAQ